MTRHFHRELEVLKSKILSLGAIVEDSVRKAVDAIESRDTVLAREVLERDSEIDRMEVEVEEDCLKILALYQPVAIDLRFIVAVLKINNDLERIGDLASNIAERTPKFGTVESFAIPDEFLLMAEKAQQMLKKSLNALITMDARLARTVWVEDNEVDRLNGIVRKQAREEISGHPERSVSLMNLASASQRLERIADLATNIAEDVVYMMEGEIIRHRYEEPE